MGPSIVLWGITPMDGFLLRGPYILRTFSMNFSVNDCNVLRWRADAPAL
jgi:hypothetical protein